MLAHWRVTHCTNVTLKLTSLGLHISAFAELYLNKYILTGIYSVSLQTQD